MYHMSWTVPSNRFRGVCHMYDHAIESVVCRSLNTASCNVSPIPLYESMLLLVVYFVSCMYQLQQDKPIQQCS